MTDFVDIKPGQWVLAFNEPYGPHMSTMADHLENFSHRGGGWDTHSKAEVLHVYEVDQVMPKTYTVGETVTHDRPYLSKRQCRMYVIAAGSKGEMLELRDKFFAIGVEADDRIHAEMYRRIEKFSDRERARALQRVHRLLPHHFGRGA